MFNKNSFLNGLVLGVLLPAVVFFMLFNLFNLLGKIGDVRAATKIMVGDIVLSAQAGQGEKQ